MSVFVSVFTIFVFWFGYNLQTASFFLHIYKIKFTDKGIKIGEIPSELCFATLSLLLSEQVPFAGKDLSV